MTHTPSVSIWLPALISPILSIKVQPFGISHPSHFLSFPASRRTVSFCYRTSLQLAKADNPHTARQRYGTTNYRSLVLDLIDRCYPRLALAQLLVLQRCRKSLSPRTGYANDSLKATTPRSAIAKSAHDPSHLQNAYVRVSRFYRLLADAIRFGDRIIWPIQRARQRIPGWRC